MVFYGLFCLVTALFFSKKDFDHLLLAIGMSMLLTPLGGYYYYRHHFKDEIEAEREAKRLREAIRREQAVKSWYISRISDAEADHINSLPTHAERLHAAQQAVDRLIEADRHDPHAPEPPFRPPYY
jgi:hypothetical protein